MYNKKDSNKHVDKLTGVLYHRRPKLTIRGIDQIFMIYLRVSSETWLLYVCGVVLHIGPLSARSTRHCMEFKITRDKIGIKLSKWTHLAWFLLSIWPISSFLGGFQVFVVAFYRRSQGWTLLFRKTWTERPFSRRNSNPLLDFSLQRKEG